MDNNDFPIATDFHTLVALAQRNELEEAEEKRKTERAKALALRREADPNSRNMSELMSDMLGDDPEQRLEDLNSELDRQQEEAAEAVKAKEKANAQERIDQFPAPPTGPQ